MSKYLLAPAKINLGLEILGKREDGYHNLETVFSQVSLYDEVALESLEEDKILVECDKEGIPLGESNTVYKAVMLLRQKCGVERGVKVIIKKRIPMEAGLGGGSSDAAAVFLGLNQMWNLGLQKQRLMELAVSVGADVPYQIVGGTKLARGVGEVIEELPSISGMSLVICVPEMGVSTKWAFSNVKYDQVGKGKIKDLVTAIKEKDIFKIAKSLHNDFEYWVLEAYPEISAVKEKLLSLGALGAVMTGSGSGVFGIFENKFKAKEAFDKLGQDYPKTYLVKTL